MLEYKYLIVGGGMAADSAVQSIRKVDPNGSIGMICQEDHSPYDRPPLSKGLWFNGVVDDIWRNTGNLGVNLHLSRVATTLHPSKKVVYDHEGQVYQYEKLLIATGSKPRQLASGVKDIIYLRGLDDYFKLKALIDDCKTIGVIGGSFMSSEIASSLSSKGKKITMIFPERGILASTLPVTISRQINEDFMERDIDLVKEDHVASAEKIGNEIVLKTGRGDFIAFDVVVAGMGCLPETNLATTSDLKVADGIIVDKHLRTSKHDIFAAGDVACFPSAVLGSVIRYTHADNANAMGVAAGLNMAGKQTTFDYLPAYSSTLFDFEFTAIGDVNTRYDYIIDWKAVEQEKGIVYYLVNGLVRGVLFWNMHGDIEAARALISKGKLHNVHTLKGLLPA